jgi:hypothetical protein
MAAASEPANPPPAIAISVWRMAHVSVLYPWRQNAEWSFKEIGADWTGRQALTVDFDREIGSAVGLS